MTKTADFILDIRKDRCPITFVKTKLLIEKMEKGQQACILFAGTDVLASLPHSIRALGHTILSLSPDVTEDEESDYYILTLLKN